MVMKKDIFNGKILREFRGITAFGLILGTVVFLAVAVLLFFVAFSQNDGTRIAVFCFSAVAFLLAILFPTITIYLIRIYPKRRKITRLLIREYVFREYDNCEEKKIYKDY
jgi:hypothetical protein